MYIIIAYDVESKKCPKIMKLLRKYLFHIQNSLFEGEITDKNYIEMMSKLKSLINNKDSIIVYKLLSDKYLYKDNCGPKLMIKNII